MTAHSLFKRVEAITGLCEGSENGITQARFCRLLESAIDSLLPLARAAGEEGLPEGGCGVLELNSKVPLPESYENALCLAVAYYLTMKPKIKVLCDDATEKLAASIPASIEKTVEAISSV